MTVITITDPTLIEQLRHADAVEFRDPDGRVLGRFPSSNNGPSEQPTYTRDDVRRFREQLEAARRAAEAEGVRPEESGRLPPGLKLPPLPDRGPAHLQSGKPLLEALRDLEERL